MKKLKQEKGITLIALVVTIVILLILAGITIGILFSDNGIIKQAQDAAQATNEAEQTTQEGLQSLANKLEETLNNVGSSNNGWKQNGTQITGPNGESLEVGDIILYDCKTEATNTSVTSYETDNGYADQTFELENYSGNWYALGVENGKLLIVSSIIKTNAIEEVVLPASYSIENNDDVFIKKLSSVNLASTDEVNYKNFYLYGQTGCKNGISELKKISELYAQSKFAESSRSINIEDINRVTGYDPYHTGLNKYTGAGEDKGKANAGALYEEGVEVIFSWNGTEYPSYTATNGLSGTLSYGHSNGFSYFKNGQWTKASYTTTAGEIVKLKNINAYWYHPETLEENNDTYNSSASIGISQSSKAYQALFANTDENYYWLGSQLVCVYSYYAYFGLSKVGNGCVGGNYLAGSYGFGIRDWCGVRVAVSLKSNIKLTETANGYSLSF